MPREAQGGVTVRRLSLATLGLLVVIVLLGGCWAWLTVYTVNERAQYAHGEVRYTTVFNIDAYTR